MPASALYPTGVENLTLARIDRTQVPRNQSDEKCCDQSNDVGDGYLSVREIEILGNNIVE